MKTNTTARKPAPSTGDGVDASPAAQQPVRNSDAKKSKQKANSRLSTGTQLGRPVTRSSESARQPPRENVWEPAASASTVSGLTAPEASLSETFNTASPNVPLTELPAHSEPRKQKIFFDETTLRRLEVPGEIFLPAAKISPASTRSVVSDPSVHEAIEQNSLSGDSSPTPEVAASAVLPHTEPRTKTVRVDAEALRRIALRRIGVMLGMAFDEASVSTNSTGSPVNEVTQPKESRHDSLSGGLPLTSEQILRRLGALLGVDIDEASLSGDFPKTTSWKTFELAIPKGPPPDFSTSPESRSELNPR